MFSESLLTGFCPMSTRPFPSWADSQAKACATQQPRVSGSYGAQLLEQCLGVLQIGGIEALGEPAVDLGEPRARLLRADHAAKPARSTHQ